METNNDFLPADYSVPASENKYMKLVKGDNKFRILEKPIFGWEAWTEDAEGKHPVRFKMDAKPVDLRQYKDQKVSHFWAMPVWDFNSEAILVLQITQKTIQQALEGFARNEDWGSPLGYNITVNRKGDTQLTTEYTVTPSPHSDVPMDAEDQFASLKAGGFDISRLYTGGDPFKDTNNA